MKELIDNLKNHLTEENMYIVEELINIIIEKSINNTEELLELENYKFTIDDKVLSREERVKYCYNSVINSYYDADALDFEEALDYYKYYDLLKSSTKIEDKIKYIVLLYDMTRRPQLLVYELYNCIMKNQL